MEGSKVVFVYLISPIICFHLSTMIIYFVLQISTLEQLFHSKVREFWCNQWKEKAPYCHCDQGCKQPGIHAIQYFNSGILNTFWCKSIWNIMVRIHEIWGTCGKKRNDGSFQWQQKMPSAHCSYGKQGLTTKVDCTKSVTPTTLYPSFLP